MPKRNIFTTLFVFVISLLYGIIAAGQIAGISRLYSPYLVIPLSILLTVVIYLLYTRLGKSYFQIFESSRNAGKAKWFTVLIIICGSALFILLVFYPLFRWPFSPISTELTWDAGLYHFPKAAEMLSTGSAWDLSIAYGEYPFGYESMIALALLFNHPGLLIGSAHALIAVFAFLAVLLLLAQRTKLPKGLLLLAVSLVFVGYKLAPSFDSNIWAVFWPQVTLIGKNDLLLAAALIAVLLHTPTSKEGPFFPLGLAVASMIALSIKPNAGLVVLFAWLAMFFFLLRAKQFRAYFKQLVLCLLIVIPGVLWVARNLTAQGVVISDSVMQLAARSIAGNLANPYFYHYIPQHLFIILGIIGIALIVSIFKPRLRFEALSSVILLVTFAFSPASVFAEAADQPLQVAWRFGMALLVYALLLLLMIFEPVILSVYQWLCRRKVLMGLAGMGLVLFTTWGVWSQRELLTTHPENAIVLRDQFRQPVGVDGYFSAYDYVQQNVHDSVVIIENGLPYYLYDEDFSNSVTRAQPADYIVYIRDASPGSAGYPATLEQSDWLATWELVYSDTEGRVYRRR
jgi:hypothetical protein